MLGMLIETYAMLFGKKEPVEMGTHDNKTKDGWREERGDKCSRTSRWRARNATQKVNNRSRMEEPVVIIRSGQISRVQIDCCDIVTNEVITDVKTTFI